MKKTLAILLSLALVICMIPATAFATETGLAVELTNASVTYNGQNQPPTIKSATYNGITIEDLSAVTGISTEANAYVDANSYTITCSYKPSENESAVTKDVTYTINALEISKTPVTISVTGKISDTYVKDATVPVGESGLTFYYNGYTNSKIFSDANIDITVTAVDQVNGKATLTVQGKNNLTETVNNITVDQVPGLTAEKVALNAVSRPIYNGVAQDVKLTGTYTPSGGTPVTIYQGTDFTVLPATAKDVNQNTFTIKGIGKYAGTFNKVIDYIKPKEVGTNNGYNGIKVSEIPTQVKDAKPIVKVTDTISGKEVPLVAGTDYDCAIATNVVGINAGNAVITFKGNYSGSRTLKFNVVESTADLSGATVNFDLSGIGVYNKSVQKPNKIVVTLGGKTLTENVDYTVSYQKKTSTETVTSPVDAGTYNVILTGKGNYGGQRIVTSAFEIKQVPLDFAEIVLGSSTVLYNGVYVPKVTVKHIYSNYYFNESDYNVDYRYVNYNSSYLKPTAVVTVKPNGNLTTTGSTKSELTKEFSLASRNLSNCTVTFTDSRSSKNYDGNASFKPPVTVKDYSLNKTLTENLDYKITYKDAAGKVVYALKDAGTYSVIVEGINAYTGTKTLTFTINGTDISGYTVTLKESSVNATGYAQTPVITSVKKGVYSSLTSNDYTVTYQDATGKTVTSMSAPGTYRVVVTGKNGYSGSTYATFRIVGLPQTVTVNQDSYKVYTSSDSFKITAKATGDGTGFTYTSSNPAVASVSAAGYVTIHKVGRAVITVTTTGNKKYEPTSKDVTVKVYPSKAKISQKPSTDGKKAQMKVRWGYQDGVTKYQIRYSRDKNFKSGSYLTKTVKAHGKSYTTQSTTISNLKSGYTYYFKVRAVYTDPYTGDTYYGSWSSWRSAKTK